VIEIRNDPNLWFDANLRANRQRLLRVWSWRRQGDEMRPRVFILSLMAMPLGAPFASAQPSSKIPRVGILSLAKSEADPSWKAFRPTGGLVTRDPADLNAEDSRLCQQLPV
jgi:hypothetical protein